MRTIKLLEENINKTFSDINPSDILLDQSPKAKGSCCKVLILLMKKTHSMDLQMDITAKFQSSIFS